jgi:enterochelin esterase family protein
MLRGSIERLRFRGASLEDNPLGDPVERELLVYLPPSYATSQKRYPLLMVLTGYASTHQSLLNFKPWEPNFVERYERLLAQGCREAILVLPDCFTRWGGSQFLDSSAVGAYQRYLVDDVLPFVEGRYRTLPGREARAVLGKSSGGFGALRMLTDRPEAFAVAGSHAGDSAFDLSIRPRFVEVAPIYEKHGGLAGFVERMREQGAPRSQGEFHALEIAALAAIYVPLNEGPWPRGALPFDPYTAQIIPEIWARWLAHDPIELVASRTSQLRDARLVFLDAGKSDEYGLQFGARVLAQRLTAAGVRVHHEEFEGGHMATAHRYDVSLPTILAALPEASLASVEHGSSERAPHAHSVKRL